MRHARIVLAGLIAAMLAAAPLRAGEWDDCANTGAAERAVAACTRLIEGAAAAGMPQADLSTAHFNRGAAESGRQDYGRAIDDYGKAIALDPASARAYNGRGVAFALQGDHARALQDYDRALAIDPDFGDALNNRADAFRNLGQLDRALADLDHLIAVDPTLVEAYYTRGEVDLDRGELARARADLLQGMRLDTAGTHHDYATSLIAEIDRRLATPPPAPSPGAERRVALVIGNGAYRQTGQLANPPNDARVIAAALKQAGFDRVDMALDLDRAGMVKALQALGSAADSADWAVVYFAGHGLEIGGVNYLVPVDARLATDRDVPDEAISLDRVLAAVEGAHKLRLVVLDACRNNPFLVTMRSTSATRAIGRGLARVEPSQATLVAYSAKEGTVASDGEAGNSPFAAALARRVTEAGVEINKVFRFVRSDVLTATGGVQEPFVYGSLPPEDFFFVPPG